MPFSNILLPNETTGRITIDAVEHPLSELHVYKITEQDLDTIKNASFSKSLYSIGTSVSLTALISFLTIVLTIEISNNNLYAIFIGIIIGASGIFIVLLILSIKCVYDSKKIYDRIKGTDMQRLYAYYRAM